VSQGSPIALVEAATMAYWGLVRSLRSQAAYLTSSFSLWRHWVSEIGSGEWLYLNCVHGWLSSWKVTTVSCCSLWENATQQQFSSRVCLYQVVYIVYCSQKLVRVTVEIYRGWSRHFLYCSPCFSLGCGDRQLPRLTSTRWSLCTFPYLPMTLYKFCLYFWYQLCSAANCLSLLHYLLIKDVTSRIVSSHFFIRLGLPLEQ